MNSQDKARGRWFEILTTLGVSAKVLNGKHQECPFCGGKDRFRWTDKYKAAGDGGFFCSGCGPGGGFEFVIRLKGVAFAEAARMVDEITGREAEAQEPKPIDPERQVAWKRAKQMWQASRPITAQSPAGMYLKRRCGLESYPDCLRYLDGSWDQGYSSMLAKVIGPDGKTASLHITYLTLDGQKAPIDRPRRYVSGLTIPKGSAIRLARPAGALGIAEGIETALSAEALYGVPCWSVLDAGNMKTFRVPMEVQELWVFGDNDKNHVGQEAAHGVARSHYQTSIPIPVHVKIPVEPGDDWNDVHMRLMALKDKKICA